MRGKESLNHNAVRINSQSKIKCLCISANTELGLYNSIDNEVETVFGRYRSF